MLKEYKKYRVVASANLSELYEIVEKYNDQGWQPTGGPSYKSGPFTSEKDKKFYNGGHAGEVPDDPDGFWVQAMVGTFKLLSEKGVSMAQEAAEKRKKKEIDLP